MVDDIVRANSGAAASVPDMMARFSWASREARQVRFAPDSPLEGDGFEPSVPLQIRSRFRDLSPVPLLTGSRPGTGSSNPSPSSGESCANHGLRGDVRHGRVARREMILRSKRYPRVDRVVCSMALDTD